MDNQSTQSDRLYRTCIAVLLAAIVLINLLSGFIRHTEAGLGCLPWPECYGLIGNLVPDPQASVTQLALAPTETAKRMHRGIATLLVVLILIVTYHARSRLPARGIVSVLPYLLIAVMLLLAIIGPASYLKTQPAIASINLLGGMTLLALGWWVRLSTIPIEARHRTVPPTLSRIALLLLIVQIALGGWVSANFAGVACTDLWTCTAAAPANPLSSFWYFRELSIDEAGRVIMSESQIHIHLAHRFGALVTTALLGWLGVTVYREGGLAARWGAILLLLLGIQLLLAFAAVTNNLPLLVVLGHNLIASALLLTLVRLVLLSASSADKDLATE